MAHLLAGASFGELALMQVHISMQAKNMYDVIMHIAAPYLLLCCVLTHDRGIQGVPACCFMPNSVLTLSCSILAFTLALLRIFVCVALSVLVCNGTSSSDTIPLAYISPARTTTVLDRAARLSVHSTHRG